MEFKSIGEKIKYFRLKSKLTLEEVGKKINVTKQTLYKYENNIITNIPADKIESLAQLFEISPAYLMGWEEFSSNSLVDKIKKLPSTKQKEVEKIINHLSSGETIAAHRSDDPMAELPEEARKSIEDFKKFIFEKHGIKYN